MNFAELLHSRGKSEISDLPLKNVASQDETISQETHCSIYHTPFPFELVNNLYEHISLLVSRLRAQITHAHKEHPVARDLTANHSSASVQRDLLEKSVKRVMYKFNIDLKKELFEAPPINCQIHCLNTNQNMQTVCSDEGLTLNTSALTQFRGL